VTLPQRPVRIVPDPVQNGLVDEQGDGQPIRSSSWGDSEKAVGYLGRIGTLPPRTAGEDVLRSLLPVDVHSVLDLGCGDGRLAALVIEERPAVDYVLGLDSSLPMLDHARRRFAETKEVEVQQWDLGDSIASFGSFDVIVSGFAIHHLRDERKQDLYSEAARQLRPSGLFANLEVVASSTPELHAEFLALIGREADDPEDRLVDIESQLGWMRNAGLTQVDCFWRWRGFALLAGRAQLAGDGCDDGVRPDSGF